MAVLGIDEGSARCRVLRVVNGLSVWRKNWLAEFFLVRLGRLFDKLDAAASNLYDLTSKCYSSYSKIINK